MPTWIALLLVPILAMGSSAQAALLATLGIKTDPGANTPTRTSDAIAAMTAPGFLEGIQRQQYQSPTPAPTDSSSPSGSSFGGGGGAYSGSGGAALLRDAAAKAGFTGPALDMAVKIGMAESGGNPNATNTAGNSAGTDRGLFQINDYYHRDLYNGGFNWSDPYANARAAYAISGGGTNWTPWSTYNSGAYRRYGA